MIDDDEREPRDDKGGAMRGDEKVRGVENETIWKNEKMRKMIRKNDNPPRIQRLACSQAYPLGIWGG